MKTLFGSWMLLALASISQAASAPEQNSKYGFATRDYSIGMTVTFLDPYLGRRLAFFSDSGKELCYSAGDGTAGRCVEQFVGAVAIVTYSVKLANGGIPGSISIRECVTVSAQSSGLPVRAPFSMTQKLVKGIGSDVQAFGYDEGPLTHAERTSTRRQAQAKWWRLCRQELYVDEERRPFAIVEWRYTLNGINIMHIYAP